MYGDTKKFYDRVTFRNTYLKIARSIVYAGFVTMFVMGLTIVFCEMQTAKAQANIALKETIYLNVKN